MSVERIAVPRLPSGGVRKKMPAPFARPSISIGGVPPAERRVWTATLATNLKVGDIVPGVGRVFRVTESISTPRAHSGLAAREIADQVAWTVTVEGGMNNVKVYPGNQSVWAFTVPAGE